MGLQMKSSKWRGEETIYTYIYIYEAPDAGVVCSPFSEEVYFEGIFSGVNNSWFIKECHLSCLYRLMFLQMSG